MLLESPLAQRKVFSPLTNDLSDSDDLLYDDPEFDDEDDVSAIPPPHQGRIDCLGLKTFTVDTDPLPRISTDEFANIITNGSHGYQQVVVVDCRFEYEYAGGHIDDAVNLLNHELLEEYFFSKVNTPAGGRVPNTLFVFHCEFLVYRGPNMAAHLRKLDRRANVDHYPNLSFPDVVVLDGGYKDFWLAHPGLCGGYLPMLAETHADTCAASMNRARNEAKLIKRAKLYHFTHPHANVAAHARSRSYTAVAALLVAVAVGDKVVKRVRLKTKGLRPLVLFCDHVRRPPPTPWFGQNPDSSWLLVLLSSSGLGLEPVLLALLMTLVDVPPLLFQFPPPSLLAKSLRSRLVALATPGDRSPGMLPFLTLIEDSAMLTNSFIDPINDTPVDFSVPTPHTRTLLVLTALYSFVEE